jgi:hypothetical protein
MLDQRCGAAAMRIWSKRIEALLRRSPENGRRIAQGWFIIGVIGLLFIGSMDLAHFLFGVPFHLGHTASGRLLSDFEIVQFSAIMALGFGFFAVFGRIMLRRLEPLR